MGCMYAIFEKESCHQNWGKSSWTRWLLGWAFPLCLGTMSIFVNKKVNREEYLFDCCSVPSKRNKMAGLACDFVPWTGNWQQRTIDLKGPHLWSESFVWQVLPLSKETGSLLICLVPLGLTKKGNRTLLSARYSPPKQSNRDFRVNWEG